MKKRIILYFLFFCVLFFLGRLFFYQGGRVAQVERAAGDSFVFKYDRPAAVYVLEFRELPTGKDVATALMRKNGQPYEFYGETVVIVKSLGRYLRKKVPYVALMGTDSGYVVGVFCDTGGQVLNMRKGWFPESDDVFLTRCKSSD